MKRTKVVAPYLLQEFGQVRHFDEYDTIAPHPIRFGERLLYIFFDDLEFDTPEPKLPLWFRIREWYNAK